MSDTAAVPFAYFFLRNSMASSVFLLAFSSISRDFCFLISASSTSSCSLFGFLGSVSSCPFFPAFLPCSSSPSFTLRAFLCSLSSPSSSLAFFFLVTGSSSISALFRFFVAGGPSSESVLGFLLVVGGSSSSTSALVRFLTVGFSSTSSCAFLERSSTTSPDFLCETFSLDFERERERARAVDFLASGEGDRAFLRSLLGLDLGNGSSSSYSEPQPPSFFLVAISLFFFSSFSCHMSYYTPSGKKNILATHINS